jgi:hypothetical protein
MSRKSAQPNPVTCFAPRDNLPRTGPGWLEEDLEDVLQGELDLPLRSKATGHTIVRVTSAVSRHVKVSTRIVSESTIEK